MIKMRLITKAGLFLSLPLMFSACSGMASGGGSDVSSRMSNLENRVSTLSNQVEGTQSADVYNNMQGMQQELSVVRSQMNDLNTRMSGPQGAEAVSYNQRLDRLETAIRQMASQLGVKVEALDTPYTPSSPQSNAGPEVNYRPSATPDNPDGAAQNAAATGAEDTSAQPATNPDGTVTVMVNGVPQKLKPRGSYSGVVAGGGSSAAATTTASASAPAASGDLAKALYDRGLSYYNKGQYKEALQCFKDFTSHYPSNKLASNAWYWQGESSYQSKDYNGAIVAYQKVIASHAGSDKTPASMLKQGMALSASGNKAAAKVRWKDLVAKYPKSPEAGRAQKLINS